MKAARFYVDAEGHPNEKGMQNALDEMKFYTLEGSIKILGSYLRNIPTKIYVLRLDCLPRLLPLSPRCEKK